MSDGWRDGTCRGLLDVFESHKIHYPSVMLRSANIRHGRSTYLLRTHDEGDLHYFWTTASDTIFRIQTAEGLQGLLDILSCLSETPKLSRLVSQKRGKKGGIKEPFVHPKMAEAEEEVAVSKLFDRMDVSVISGTSS